MAVVYLKVLIISILPFVIFITNMIYWVLAHRFLQKKNTLNLFFFTTIILQYFLQPTVLKEISIPLLCSQIDEKLYIKKYMDISCEDSTYNAWV